MTIEQDVAEIRALVYRMAECYGARDVDGVLGTFAGEGSSMVGTGLDELRFGVDAMRLQITRDLSEVGTVSFGMDAIRVDLFGDAAFAFADTVVSATFGSELLRIPLRATFGLCRTDDGWRIALCGPRE